MKKQLLTLSTLLLPLFSAHGQINFQQATSLTLQNLTVGSASFSDIDGDADLDLLISGESLTEVPFQPLTKLYVNNGSGILTEVANTPFANVGLSAAAFADIDGDGDMDVLLMGMDAAMNPKTRLYANDNNGDFSEVTNTPFPDLAQGSIAVADIDGD